MSYLISMEAWECWSIYLELCDMMRLYLRNGAKKCNRCIFIGAITLLSVVGKVFCKID